MDLRGYEQRKFELSEILQSAAALTSDLQTQDLQDRFRDLLIRLAEDRFNLVLAGRFNRGKSSSMNALLGMDRLPTRLMPLTSVVTTVTYGSSEQVTLRYRERRLDNLIRLKDLPHYETEQGNPGNKLGIATATIELPAEILRRGFYFVDTPGLGSVIVENTHTTRAFLPEADALLLVTSFESPLSEDELDFFTAASHARLPAFVVINKHDLVTQVERDQVIAFIQLHLSKFQSPTRPEILSVSARDGLEAKLARDETLLRASGLPVLEDRLIRFLLKQKRTVFLSRMCNRVDELIRQLPETEQATSLRRRLGALLASLQVSGDPGDAGLADYDFAPTFNRHLLKSCQICSAVEDETWDFLARYQFELSFGLQYWL
jgi:GTP-binding protein EngB required for normal cell division